MVFDAHRQRLSGSDRSGDAIHIINAETLQLTGTLDLGLEPAGVDISPSGSKLAVAVASAGEIAFVDLNTLSVTARVTPRGTNGRTRPIDVIYGRPGRIYSVGTSDGDGYDFMHVYDSAAKVEIRRKTDKIWDESRLALNADQNRLYVTEPSLSYYDVSTDTPYLASVAPGGWVDWSTLCILVDGRRVTSGGQVYDGDLSQAPVRMSSSGTEAEYGAMSNRICLSEASGPYVRIHRSTDLAYIGTAAFGTDVGVAREDASGQFLYISTSLGLKKIGTGFATASYLPLTVVGYCADFEDDFGNPASGWPILDERYVSAAYDGGEYVVRTRRLGYMYLFAAPACFHEDYYVDVDARWIGDPGNSNGIVFGIEGDFDQFYLFEVNSELKQYRLLFREAGGWTILLPPLQSDYIHSGGEKNHLRILQSDNQVIFEINGHGLHIWSDPNLFGTGRVGIMTSPYSDSLWSEARFDNFSVRQPKWPGLEPDALPVGGAGLAINDRTHGPAAFASPIKGLISREARIDNFVMNWHPCGPGPGKDSASESSNCILQDGSLLAIPDLLPWPTPQASEQ